MLTPLRLTRPGLKILYVIVVIFGLGALRLMVSQWLSDAPLLVLQSVAALLEVVWFASIVFACRIFRVSGEPVAPPRPWWRMTYRPWLSWALSLWAASQLVLVAWQTGEGVLGGPVLFVDLPASVGLTFLYAHSGWLLNRMGRQERSEPVDTDPAAVDDVPEPVSGGTVPYAQLVAQTHAVEPRRAWKPRRGTIVIAISVVVLGIGSVIGGASYATTMMPASGAGASHFDQYSHQFSSATYHFSAAFPSAPSAAPLSGKGEQFRLRTAHGFYDVITVPMTTDVAVDVRPDSYRRLLADMEARESKLLVTSTSNRTIGGDPALLAKGSMSGVRVATLFFYCSNRYYLVEAGGPGTAADFVNTFSIELPSGATCD